jgi:hypothetical protein
MWQRREDFIALDTGNKQQPYALRSHCDTRFVVSLICLLSPNCSGKEALLAVRLIEVENGDKIAIRPLNRSWIAQIGAYSPSMYNNLILPGLTFVLAEKGANGEWLAALPPGKT